MKEFRYTLTINVFIKAEDAEKAQEKFEDMSIEFEDNDTWDLFDFDIVDVDSEEVVG